MDRLISWILFLLSNPWLVGAIGWALVFLDYPYGNILPVYAE